MTSVADPASVAHRYTRRGIAFLIVGFVASAVVRFSQLYGYDGGGIRLPGGLGIIDMIFGIIGFAAGALNYLPHFCFALGAMYLGVGIVLRALAAGWFRSWGWQPGQPTPPGGVGYAPGATDAAGGTGTGWAAGGGAPGGAAPGAGTHSWAPSTGAPNAAPAGASPAHPVASAPDADPGPEATPAAAPSPTPNPLDLPRAAQLDAHTPRGDASSPDSSAPNPASPTPASPSATPQPAPPTPFATPTPHPEADAQNPPSDAARGGEPRKRKRWSWVEEPRDSDDSDS
ncbi:hypothetical protein GCM10027515_14900 [Schumannella luteola]|uniref:Uncharacterized protein n=1 Tax=Schumannella luteola TaxID=472059 RepID=A0A852YL57_9MICO|nr:hypothetical protein [Schumannella luteola]NYG97935.1 hypothetical protein [Schumannella luteola]TPX03070.1 hypothetical protein FJ656_19230 [Schumannella luteola]